MNEQLSLFIGPVVQPPPALYPTLEDVQHAIWQEAPAAWYKAAVYDNYWSTHEDNYGTWDACIKAGKDYLVGDSQTMPEFLRKHTSSMPGWMQKAALWAWYNPDKKLNLRGRRLEYEFCKRGEYVDVALPHHDMGGERNWITRDFHKRVLINID